MNVHWRKRLWWMSIFSLAALLTLYRVPLVSSQGVVITVARVEGEVPARDSASPEWQKATAIEVPLSAQQVTKPFLLNASVRTVTVRALHNDAQIAILVEWEDATENAQMVRVQDFRDAVALQFPLAAGPPFYCMGQAGANVNIWHWKADWQADLIARADMHTVYTDMYVDAYTFADPEKGKQASIADYSETQYVPAMAVGNLFANTSLNSPVEDLIAGGFGSLTAQLPEEQNVQGYGVWENERWKVIFTRMLQSPDEADVNFVPGKEYAISFAVWDGANQERNGQKSTSQWVTFVLEGAPAPAQQPAAPAPAAPSEALPLYFWIIVGGIALLFILGVAIYIKLPEEGQK